MNLMTLLNLQASLLAQRAYPERTLRLQEAFRGYRAAPQDSVFSSVGNLLLILGIVLAVLIVVAKIVRRNSRPVAARNPRRFFSTTLKRLGATYTDRLLMHQAAHQAQLAQPAMMLLSPELFQRYALDWADQLRLGFFRRRVRARFQAIADRAFAAAA
ncbi:hypothetical protein RAS2_28130 [Phycisphaerae bacterium RAS2]|nr:hypothetical protein RAS2_28130 [Phycisphaerae bacterium RAS2]